MARPGKIMTKAERSDLVKIIDGRFQVLFEDLAQRERQIADMIRDNIVSQHRDDIHRAEERAQDIFAEQNRLADAGVALVEEMRDLGVEVKAKYGRSLVGRVAMEEAPRWMPANLEHRVRDEINKMKVESGLAQTNLRREHLGIKEQLLVETLETEHAKGFLDRIPDVNTLLPMPDRKELQETNGS